MLWWCLILAPVGGVLIFLLPFLVRDQYQLHLAQLNWLRNMHGVTGLTTRLNVPRGATFEECVADGSAIYGTPERVREEIERQAAELGINYLLTYLFLGAMSLAEALRSLQLFSAEVMPRLARL